MAISHRNGIALTGLSAINGISSISALNGISASLGGGGGATTLDYFSNLVAWYQAPIAGATNGVAIPDWPNSKGGAAFDSASNNPVYTTGALNGYAATTWNGSSTKLDTGGLDASTFPYTFVAVVNVTDTSGYRTILSSSASGGIEWRIDQSTGYLNFDKTLDAGIGTGNVAVTPGTPQVLMGVATATTWAFWIDGVAAGSGSHSQSLTAGRTFTMGATTAVSVFYFLGSIYEVGIFSTDHSANASAIHGVLQTKFAL